MKDRESDSEGETAAPASNHAPEAITATPPAPYGSDDVPSSYQHSSRLAHRGVSTPSTSSSRDSSKFAKEISVSRTPTNFHEQTIPIHSTSLNTLEDDDDNDETSSTRSSSSRRYDWRVFRPRDGGWVHFLRWFVVGGASYAKKTDDKLQEDLGKLARCLILLREYLSTFGMPAKGGPMDQEVVLRQVLRDLYAGGAPLWAVEPVMQKAAEGLTGTPGINWFLLPRKAFYSSTSTITSTMFTIERGFNVQKLGAMEKVAIRLASFASNTKGVSNIPERFPEPSELQKAARMESVRFDESFRTGGTVLKSQDPSVVAKKILRLASHAEGLFYFVNAREYSEMPGQRMNDFWVVTEQERELFSRLATIEAMQMIKEIDANCGKETYSYWTISLFRVMASAGACAFWFGGSWVDMAVSGVLALVVAFIGQSKFLSQQERLVFEIVASFVVGITAGTIALKWPDDTCFGAMAIAGVLDLLQGFRVVYAVIEIMSKQTVSGGADLMEGILFTGLISSSLRFGQYTAASVFSDTADNIGFAACEHGIDQRWFILIVPIAAVSWSGLFNPRYHDLPMMAFHGSLAYLVNFGLAQFNAADNLNNFVSSFAVSFSAGIFSRFTGHQAVGNTVAGMYALVPGAYLVTSLFSTDTLDTSFFVEIIQRSLIIGIGAWSGTILCSPALLGTTMGLISQQHRDHNRRGSSTTGNAMLFF